MQFAKIKNLAFIYCGIFWLACGTKNINEDKSQKTKDEKIRIALNAEDLATAKTLLEEQIADFPEEYQRYPLLAAVYAGLAGFDLLAAVENLQSNSDSSQNPLDQISAFLTKDTDDETLGYMTDAVATIQAIPEEKRSDTSEETYGASAQLQLTLYTSAYSVMYLNQFVAIDPNTNDIDIDALENMTDEDADRIIASLVLAAESSPEAATFGAQVDKTLAQIDAQDGATSRERLINYMANK